MFRRVAPPLFWATGFFPTVSTVSVVAFLQLCNTSVRAWTFQRYHYYPLKKASFQRRIFKKISFWGFSHMLVFQPFPSDLWWRIVQFTLKTKQWYNKGSTYLLLGIRVEDASIFVGLETGIVFLSNRCNIFIVLQIFIAQLIFKNVLFILFSLALI